MTYNKLTTSAILLMLFSSNVLGSEVQSLMVGKSVAPGETIPLTSDTYTVNAGEVVVLHAAYTTSQHGYYGQSANVTFRRGAIEVRVSGTAAVVVGAQTSTTATTAYNNQIVMAGPIDIEVAIYSTKASTATNTLAMFSVATFTVYTQAEFAARQSGVAATPAASGAQSYSVVIPTDATGPVNVIMESSLDMITWNVATAGTYGNSDAGRFFRLRTVAQ